MPSPEKSATEAPGAAPPEESPVATGGSSSSPGCGFGLIAGIVLTTIWRAVRSHQPVASAFLDSIRLLWELATSAPARVLLVLMALGYTGMLLVVATNWLKEKNYGPDHFVSYLARFFPVKPLVQGINTITELGASMKRAASGETRWFVAFFTLIATIGGFDGLEAALNLPPMKAPAGLAIYLGTTKQVGAGATDDESILLNSVPVLLATSATGDQLERRLDRIPFVIWEHRADWLFSEGGVDREIVRQEVIGTSFLGVYLEWVYGVRTGSDLMTALPKDFSGRDALKQAVDDLEKTTKLSKLYQDLVLLALMAPFAVGLWLASGRQAPLFNMIGVAAVLWTAAIIVQELVYISTSLVTMIWAAHLLGSLFQLGAMQLCFLFVLPGVMTISRRRSWLAGTGAYAFVELTVLLGFLAIT